MKSARPLVLMSVFNALDFDGRVQRSAAALAANWDVTVLALDGGRGWKAESYQHEAIAGDISQLGRNRWLHVRFFGALMKRAVTRRPAVVYAHDTFLAFPGYCAARISGARFVYDAHELVIPDQSNPAMTFRDRFWYLLERAVVGRADLVIAANKERAMRMRHHYGLKATPTVVQNSSPAPKSVLDSHSLVALYPKLARRSSDELLCVYQGEVELNRGLDVLLDAVAALPLAYRLVVVGGGPDLEVVQRRESARIVALGRVPRAHLYDILKACDVGVATYPFRGLNNIYCAPNKVIEYVQAGLPIVATGQPPLRSAITENGIGVIAGDGGPPSPTEMARAIVDASALVGKLRLKQLAYLDANRWEVFAEELKRQVRAIT